MVHMIGEDKDTPSHVPDTARDLNTRLSLVQLTISRDQPSLDNTFYSKNSKNRMRVQKELLNEQRIF